VGVGLGDADVCGMQKVTSEFVQGGSNLRDLIVKMTTSDLFRYRRAKEVCQ
jgi:hypothetical protein